MTHDIPRFGTPDGGLTWASTGTHGGWRPAQPGETPGELTPEGVPPMPVELPVGSRVRLTHGERGTVTQVVRDDRDAVYEYDVRLDGGDGGTLVAVQPRHVAALAGYLDGEPPYTPLDDGLTWAEQVARRDAEIVRLRALVRTVISYGTGYVWRDRTTGKEHLLNPTDVRVVIGAQYQTELEQLRARIADLEATHASDAAWLPDALRQASAAKPAGGT